MLRFRSNFEAQSEHIFVLDEKKLSILIADDSEDLRTRLRNVISGLPGVVLIEESTTAYEAIAFVEQQPVDIAILDIQMPGSGIRALNVIKKSHPDTTVIMLTNHADPFYRKTCLKTGADFFLDKSMEFDSLPSLLRGLAST